jgi:hypothetical protein
MIHRKCLWLFINITKQIATLNLDGLIIFNETNVFHMFISNFDCEFFPPYMWKQN